MTLIGIVSEYNWKIDFGTLGTLYKELVVGAVVETPCCALLNEKLTIPAIAFQTVKANGQLRSIDEAALWSHQRRPRLGAGFRPEPHH